MSSLLEVENFGDKLYGTLPQMYRTDDESVEYALKRYLQSLADGGYATVLKGINGLLDLKDPDKIPSEFLPSLFKSYGMEIFNGIPEVYLRKLLPMVSELYKMKGSITDVEYLTSIVSGVKVDVVLDKDYSTNHKLDIKLEMDYEAEDKNEGLPDRDQLKRIIREFVPFFCNVTIVYAYVFYEIATIHGEEEAVTRFKVKIDDTDKLKATEKLSERITDLKKDSGTFNNDKYYDKNGYTNSLNYLTNSTFRTFDHLYDYAKITTKGETHYVSLTPTDAFYIT